MSSMTISLQHRPALLNAVAGKLAAVRESRRIAKLQRQVAAANAGRITIREHLQRLGADEQTIRSVESRVGKAVAAAYRAQTGQEPEKTGSVLVRGEIFPVFAYSWADLDLVSRAALTVPAVVSLIGA